MSTATALRYQEQYNRIRARAGEQAATLFASLQGLSQAEIDRYVTTIAPAMAGAQAATARLVAGYLTQMSIENTGVRFPYSVDPDEVSGPTQRGVAATNLYARPAVEARTAVTEGRSLEEAMHLGVLRARAVAETDVTLTQRAATTSALSADPRVVGYRRTLTGESCALCATASVQRYRTDRLMPIHTACDCGIAPIYGTEDPGQTINRELLSDLQAQEPEYWKSKAWGVDEDGTIRVRREVPVLGDDGNPLRTPEGGIRRRMELGDPVESSVRTHGELGPTLVDSRHAFTGPR